MKPLLLNLLALYLGGLYVLAYIWYVTLYNKLFYYYGEFFAFQDRLCPMELVFYIV
jgi:hypothetical protein